MDIGIRKILGGARGLSAHFIRRLPQKGSLPKAFQTNAKRLFGFFDPPLFTKASFRHSLETKKPIICMRGFVATLGASLDEFAGDVMAILELTINSK